VNLITSPPSTHRKKSEGEVHFSPPVSCRFILDMIKYLKIYNTDCYTIDPAKIRLHENREVLQI